MVTPSRCSGRGSLAHRGFTRKAHFVVPGPGEMWLFNVTHNGSDRPTVIPCSRALLVDSLSPLLGDVRRVFVPIGLFTVSTSCHLCHHREQSICISGAPPGALLVRPMPMATETQSFNLGQDME